MKKKIILFFLLCAQILSATCLAEELPELPKGPLLLTSVKPEQLSADYWINRLPEPDKVLLDAEQIARFNADIHAMVTECVDVFKMGTTKSGKSVRDQIELEYKAVRGRGLYDPQNNTYPKSYFDTNIKPVINVSEIPEKIKIRWAVARKATSVRALPTDTKMFEKKDDPEFDMLQFSLIKLWTPVAVYHTSSDGKWVYLQAPYIRGWVKQKDLVFFENRSDIKKLVKPESAKGFLVVTGDHIPVFSSSDEPSVILMASMGTILPLKAKVGNNYEVWMPKRKEDGGAKIYKAYVRTQTDVSVGFIKYTQRNVIEQAFKLLGARYGWGGTYNGRDCSGFTQDVFLPFGLAFPRSSKGQGFAGTQINHFKPYEDEAGKAAAIRLGTPAVTMLRMPSHQMIYLGEVDGEFYVIHCTWAERYSMDSDAKNRINQVVVSDVTLNGNSHLGSLFDRIITVSEVL